MADIKQILYKQIHMKQIQSALMIVAFLALASCSGGQENNSTEEAQNEITAEEQKEVEALEQITNEVQETAETLNEEAENLENDLDSLLN